MEIGRNLGQRVLCGACLAIFAFVPNPVFAAQDSGISAPAGSASSSVSGTCSDTSACGAQAEREARDVLAQLQVLQEQLQNLQTTAPETAKLLELAAEARDNQNQYQDRELTARVAEEAANAREAALTAQDAEAAPPKVAQAFRIMPPQTSQAGDEGWLGVQIGEVTSQTAKDLKLSSERGVVISSVSPDSPAAKAGLRANDVVTHYNGENVEGTEQFRRLVRETPPHRTVTLTISRDGRQQSISVQLGDSAQAGREQSPRVFHGFDNTRLAMPLQEWPHVFSSPNLAIFASRSPILGITAEDLSGQLGAYFGAPHDEGILVRDVLAQSAAEKAGVKAGDVIVSANGKPVRSISELRAQLPVRSAEKAVTLSLGLLRKGSEMNVAVTIEPPQRSEPPALHSAQL